MHHHNALQNISVSTERLCSNRVGRCLASDDEAARWIHYRNSREIVGEVKNVTASQSCAKWYVSIQTEYEVADPVHHAEAMVGPAARVTKLAKLSHGSV